jgi:hypothetical protein
MFKELVNLGRGSVYKTEFYFWFLEQMLDVFGSFWVITTTGLNFGIF